MRLAQTVLRDALFVLSFALLCTSTLAQTQAGLGPPLGAPILVDKRRAQKAIELGEKAEAEGRLNDALAAYDEAARYAPQVAGVLGRGAGLRAKLVRIQVDNAENLALAGNIAQATEELRLALRVDPGNAVVAERVGQMEAMKDDEPVPVAQSMEGLPELK